MNRIYDKLAAYEGSDYYGFHMPGHKRNTELMGAALPYGIDITEIEGFDDLHHPDGILKEAQERAAKLFGAEETRFLINGSTVGILSAILGNTNKGDRILVARHCHKSIYHAIYLNELRPVYLYPEFREDIHLNTEISISAVQTALLEYSDIKAVVVVSPTYDGVISDIKGIAELVHSYGIPLIVDEAHGPHMKFHPYFDGGALEGGADVVIHSVHKTLPSLTQTALLHVQGTFANRGRMFRYLDILQSSSPSYVLMASIDACVQWLEGEGQKAFEPYVCRLEQLREHLKEMKNLKLLETEHYDRSKVVISAAGTNLSGKQLSEILLKEYHLQMEMAAGTYVIAMTSPADTEEGFRRLEKALLELDHRLSGTQEKEDQRLGKLPMNEFVYTSAETLRRVDEKGCRYLEWEAAAGHISAEYAYLYPPGSPLVVPGERVSEETAGLLRGYHRMGFSIEGTQEEGKLAVLE